MIFWGGRNQLSLAGGLAASSRAGMKAKSGAREKRIQVNGPRIVTHEVINSHGRGLSQCEQSDACGEGPQGTEEHSPPHVGSQGMGGKIDKGNRGPMVHIRMATRSEEEEMALPDIAFST